MNKKINPAELVPMDIFIGQEPIDVDLVYQQAAHPRNIFEEQLYQEHARLWLHKDLAKIVILASRILLWHGSQNHKEIWHMQLKDGLRTTDTQAAMAETEIVKANPHWKDPEHMYLSPPGTGAHPRGMSIDIIPITRQGTLIPMGTEFDDMSEQSGRSDKNLPAEILQNRALLEKSVGEAAILCDQDILALPTEWWDFRRLSDHYDQFAPLSDADLPPQMQMTNAIRNDIADFPESHFEKLAEDITSAINQHNDYL